MTPPEDNLERALRQALAAAVDQVQPGPDGLERILAGIGTRRPRPRLLSIAAGAYERARHWTWRGHWAWSLRPLASVAALPWPRLLRLTPGRPGGASRPASINWLRPIAVLGGIAVIASISLGVQPFRQAIIQASNTVLTGGSKSPSGGAGTEGKGTPAESDSSASSALPASGTVPSGATSPAHAGGSTMTSGSPSPTAPSATACAEAADLTVAGLVPTPIPSTIPSALPYYSPTPTPTPSTCAAPTPSASPSPSVSSSSPSDSPSPSASATSPSPTASATSPTPVASSASPTPTATPTPTVTPTPTDSDSPSPSPSASAGGRRHHPSGTAPTDGPVVS